MSKNNSISESFKNNDKPIHHHHHYLNLTHIIPLDFNSVPRLPDSHTWTITNSDHPPPVNPISASESVPVIDLLDPSATSLVRRACERWGIFQVTNHGVPFDILYEAELQSRRLFSLPSDQKLRAIRSPDGFTGYGLARISPFFPKRMWSEGFSIAGSPEEHARRLWPCDHDHSDYFWYVRKLQTVIKFQCMITVPSG